MMTTRVTRDSLDKWQIIEGQLLSFGETWGIKEASVQ